MHLAPVLREIGLDLLALVWPTECVGCGSPNRDCCLRCVTKVRSTASTLHGEKLLGITVPVFVVGAYEGPLRAVLIAFKHGGRFGFSRVLAPRLLSEILAAVSVSRGLRAPLIVAAPSRPARVRQRGYRHLDVLLRASLRHHPEPRPRVLRALRTLPGRTGQVGLKSDERARNASLVVVSRWAGRRLKGREVVLFDDVITTGATVRATQDVLENAGARVIAVVALCVVTRRDTRQKHETGNGPRERSSLSQRRKVAPYRPTA